MLQSPTYPSTLHVRFTEEETFITKKQEWKTTFKHNIRESLEQGRNTFSFSFPNPSWYAEIQRELEKKTNYTIGHYQVKKNCGFATFNLNLKKNIALSDSF